MDEHTDFTVQYCEDCDEEFALPEEVEHCPLCNGALELIIDG